MTLLLLATAHASPISAPAVIAGPDAGPATPDPAAVFYNPAAMGGSEGVDVLADVQLSKIDLEVTTTRNDGIDPNTGEPYNVATAHVIVPVGLLGVTWSPDDWVTLGFAATDSFVGGGDYTSSETNPPPYTSHQRYAGIRTRIITVSLMPAVALTPVEGFHVGAGMSWVYDKVELMKASDPLGTEGLGFGPDSAYTADVILSADASGSHTAWNAGIFVDRFEWLQVGVSYASGSKLSVEGGATVTAPDFLSEGEGNLDIPGTMTFDLPLPPVLRLGAASQLGDKLRVGATWEIYFWDECCGDADGDAYITLVSEDGDAIGAEDGLGTEVGSEIYAPRRLFRVHNISGNGGYWITDWLWAGSRIGYKQFAVPDYAVSATNLDFETIGATAALRVRVAKPLTVGVAYTKNFLKTRTITNSAWDVRDDESDDYVDDRFSAVAPYGASANGTYSGQSNIFGVRVALDM